VRSYHLTLSLQDLRRISKLKDWFDSGPGQGVLEDACKTCNFPIYEEMALREAGEDSST
jgi:hypothetical protein